MSWGEAVDLADAALADSGTELFAASAGWRYPASSVDLLLIASATSGGDNERLMPWYQPPEMPTDAEVAMAHAELLEEIQFS